MSTMEDRKRTLRFTLATDILLLREVGRHRPWASPHGKIRDTWGQIAVALTMLINDEREAGEPPVRVDHGSSKRRYDVLMEAYAKDELKSMRAKGSAELYLQREELLADLSLQMSQFQENKIKVKRPSGGADAAAGGADAAAGVFAGLKHPRAEPTTNGADGFVDMKRQVLAPVPLPAAMSTAATMAPSAPTRVSLEPAAESREPSSSSSANRLRQRELEVAEKRLELDRQRFESEREDRSAILASMQANTSLLLRVVERLDQQAAAANVSVMNNAGMSQFLARQPL